MAIEFTLKERYHMDIPEDLRQEVLTYIDASLPEEGLSTDELNVRYAYHHLKASTTIDDFLIERIYKFLNLDYDNTSDMIGRLECLDTYMR